MPTATTYYDSGCVDFATAVVDPVDDETVWMIHEYADKEKSSFLAVVGRVKP